MLDEKSTDGVYMAVENGKHVAGFLDYTNSGIPLLKNLVSWRGKETNNVRMNLFTQFLESVGIKSNEDVVSYAEPNIKGNKWLREQGFGVPKQSVYLRQRLVMPQNTVSENAVKLENDLEKTGLKVTQYSKPRTVELTNLEL